MSSKSLKHKQKQPSRPPETLAYVQSVGKAVGGSLLAVTLLGSSVVAGALSGLALSFRDLPDVRVLKGYVPTETTHIYDITGKPIDSVHGEANREVVPLNSMSPNLKRAVLAIEDSYFYSHRGVDPNGIARAFISNWERGSVVEGGSTVTQQLVKNLFLSPEQTFNRKVAEAVLAMRLEQIFDKNEILEMYLNQVYWGHNTYGVETAAESYFNKSASELTLAESAMMAGLIQAPEVFSPFMDYTLAKQRQLLVLNRMLELKWITAAEYKQARQQPLQLGEITSFRRSEVPWITEAVIQELTDRFGSDAILKGGLRVQTTVDLRLQRIAEETVRGEHAKLRRRGLRADQMALVSLDPRTGFVKAMVGGVNYEKSQFNRALLAKRQPGSAFKPFVYYAAFASGRYTPESFISDSPVSYRDGNGWYSPQNYDNSFMGGISIRKALELSRNIPAIRLGKAVGMEKVVETSRTLGITSPMEPVTSLPLGAVDLTPIEMASAYGVFATNGFKSEPTFIARVTSNSGRVILDNNPDPQLVLDPWAAASLNSVLQGVVTQGTGKAAQLGDGRPVAGKTGTTSSERDIWFVGYVPQMVTAVWVGNDDYRPLGGGATGGGFVAPIWKDFMTKALKGVPAEKFDPPSNFERP
ncbi:transglycosylase domain-containing protein [Leptolyngbya sp. FACHB-261]|uniref:transglycosylase domain-containing protein n=1 Tax=Leptolyngbya sp. FACHB-261 TaxID=2692806 RepID=UPI0016890ABE|nr:penicillin-binding protein 1A [Leptolyngbya sp. FACHB-261]MBD2104775.1 penicillin-binding protein 1A [Leptolyngbya sp. FACHB-261]